MARVPTICACLVVLSLRLLSVSSEGYSSPDSYDTSVLILGAGAAGLQAARTLLEKNFTQFIILEGSNRTGGVLQKIQFGGLEIPSGHFMISASDLQYTQTNRVKVTRENYDSYIVRNDHGQDVTNIFRQKVVEFETATDRVDGIAREIIDGQRLDVSQKVGLAMAGWIASSPIDSLVQFRQTEFRNGLSSKYASCAGPRLQQSNGNPRDEERYIITDFKDGLFPDVERQLVAGKNLKFNKFVENIDQSGDKVIVTTKGNHQYTADHVIVAFSVGVLQQGGVTFTPDLPPWKTEQIFRYQRGTVDAIFMKFERNFWGDSEWIWHAGERRFGHLHYPGFLNLDAEGLHPGSSILVGFVISEQAQRVESLSNDQVKAEILDTLRSMFGESNISTLKEFYMERWASNPYHHGLFSTWPIPSNNPSDAPQRLAAKVGSIFFAHQASDPNIGMISGTIRASARSMELMSGCIRGDVCPDYEPVVDDGEEDKQLYGCVLVPKQPGKTRKVFPPGERPDIS